MRSLRIMCLRISLTLCDNSSVKSSEYARARTIQDAPRIFIRADFGVNIDYARHNHE